MKRRQVYEARDLARQRMQRLFDLAHEEHSRHPELSDRYVDIARRISTRLRVRMPRDLKRRFCKHCGCYLPAQVRRVRLRDGMVTVTCLRCGGIARYPYRISNRKI